MDSIQILIESSVSAGTRHQLKLCNRVQGNAAPRDSSQCYLHKIFCQYQHVAQPFAIKTQEDWQSFKHVNGGNIPSSLAFIIIERSEGATLLLDSSKALMKWTITVWNHLQCPLLIFFTSLLHIEYSFHCTNPYSGGQAPALFSHGADAWSLSLTYSWEELPPLPPLDILRYSCTMCKHRWYCLPNTSS